MTVAELIEKLQKFPPETPVILSSDAEGNSFREPHHVDADNAFWRAKERELDQDPCFGGVPCVVIQ